MKLIDLICACKEIQFETIGSLDVEIFGITSNTKKIAEGYLFVALRGAKFDGHDFIAEAIEKGAVAILGQSGSKFQLSLDNSFSSCFIACEDPRGTYPKLCSVYYNKQPEMIAGITGTNGKSSVAEFTRQLWSFNSLSAASLGTLGLVTENFSKKTNLTTPDPAELFSLVKRLAESNITHLALEASSHGLDQHRLDYLDIGVAAFTNLSRDHLDYHKNMRDYLSAKTLLFSDLLRNNGTAVINADDANYSHIISSLNSSKISVIDYGTRAKTLRLLERRVELDRQIFDLEVFGKKRTVKLNLVGGFQVSNALCALGIALASGVDDDIGLECLEKLKGVRGRLELAGKKRNGASIYIDYAHTPDALKSALIALRNHTTGRLKLVFGCGGERDIGKREEMGTIASRFADEIIITDDNPRNEDPKAIRDQIVKFVSGATVIANRKEAIKNAVFNLGANDLLIIAGKGHEGEQQIGASSFPFDDAVVAKSIIENANNLDNKIE